MDEIVYVDHIHHSYVMCLHHAESSFATTCNFIYAINEFLVAYVHYNLIIVAN
jgi:hypothetical protein